MRQRARKHGHGRDGRDRGVHCLRWDWGRWRDRRDRDWNGDGNRDRKRHGYWNGDRDWNGNGDGNDPEPLFSFLPIRLSAGGTPDNFLLHFASLDPAPSVLPGIWNLDLGGNNANLVILGGPIVGAQGWIGTELSVGSLPPGTQVYFQTAEYDPIGATLPLAESNLQTGSWIF